MPQKKSNKFDKKLLQDFRDSVEIPNVFQGTSVIFVEENKKGKGKQVVVYPMGKM